MRKADRHPARNGLVAKANRLAGSLILARPQAPRTRARARDAAKVLLLDESPAA